jgi:hypothetical protein
MQPENQIREKTRESCDDAFMVGENLLGSSQLEIKHVLHRLGDTAGEVPIVDPRETSFLRASLSSRCCQSSTSTQLTFQARRSLFLSSAGCNPLSDGSRNLSHFSPWGNVNDSLDYCQL